MSPPLPTNDSEISLRVARWIWRHFELSPADDQGEFAHQIGTVDATISQAKKAADPRTVDPKFKVSAQLLYRLRRNLGANINKMLDGDPDPADSDENEEIESRLGAIWATSERVRDWRESKAAGEPAPTRRRRAAAGA